MKKSSKILIILLVIVTSVAMVFTACDKDEQPVVDTRPQTVDRLVDVALKAQNSSWKADMTEAEIKALTAPATKARSGKSRRSVRWTSW